MRFRRLTVTDALAVASNLERKQQMRTLLIALVLASAGLAQCPNGNCPPAVRVTVTVPGTLPAPRAVAPMYAPPVYLAPAPAYLPAPVYAMPVYAAPVVLVPARTPWYLGKWASGRRGQ